MRLMPCMHPYPLCFLKDSQPYVTRDLPPWPTEAAFAESSGWSEFEDRLESSNPDLFDLGRRGII